jgi:hypothetical protein
MHDSPESGKPDSIPTALMVAAYLGVQPSPNVHSSMVLRIVVQKIWKIGRVTTSCATCRSCASLTRRRPPRRAFSCPTSGPWSSRTRPSPGAHRHAAPTRLLCQDHGVRRRFQDARNCCSECMLLTVPIFSQIFVHEIEREPRSSANTTQHHVISSYNQQ